MGTTHSDNSAFSKTQHIGVDSEKAAQWIELMLKGLEPTPSNLEAIRIPLGEKLLLPNESRENAASLGDSVLSAGLPILKLQQRSKRRRQQRQTAWRTMKIVLIAWGVMWGIGWLAQLATVPVPNACECMDIIALRGTNAAFVQDELFDTCIDEYKTLVRAESQCHSK